MPKPTPTDRFDDSELYPEATDHAGTDEFKGLPKKEDGSFDIEAMTPEQKALFWESRAVQMRTGHNKFREQAERDIETLKKLAEQGGGQNGGGQPRNRTDNFDDDDELKSLGLDPKATEVFKKAIEIGENRTLRRLGADPLFKNSIASGNRLRLDEAFRTLSAQSGYEYINDYRQEIIDDYFADPLTYPEDLVNVLETVAGKVLWSHRDEIATKKKPKHDQVDMLGGQSGNKQGSAPIRSIEYWERMAKEDPQKFASPDMQKLFNEDMAKISDE